MRNIIKRYSYILVFAFTLLISAIPIKANAISYISDYISLKSYAIVETDDLNNTDENEETSQNSTEVIEETPEK